MNGILCLHPFVSGFLFSMFVRFVHHWVAWKIWLCTALGSSTVANGSERA